MVSPKAVGVAGSATKAGLLALVQVAGFGLAAGLVLTSVAPPAKAQTPKHGVVVATTSRGVEKGARIAPGATVRVAPNASVTIMAPNGAVTTYNQTGVYRPGPASDASNSDRPGGGGMADAVGGMIQKQKASARRGAARAGDVLTAAPMDPPECAMRPAGDLASLPAELAAGCEKRAAAILAQALVAQAPAALTLYPARTGGDLKLGAIANFDSYLVCRVERAGATRGAPVGPVMLASSTEGEAGAFTGVQAGDVLACIAFEAEADARAAQRAWPATTPRAGAGRRAAAAWAPV